MSGRLATLRALLPKDAKRAVGSLALLSVLAAVAELAIFAALYRFLSKVETGGSDLKRAAILFMVAAVVAALLRLWLNARTLRLSAETGHHLAVETHRRLLAQPLAFHVGFNSARGLTMVDKVNQVTDGVLLPLIGLVQAVLIGSAALVALAFTAPRAALVVGALILLTYAILSRISSARVSATGAALGRDFDERAQTVQESFAGIRDIILDSLQAERTAAFSTIDQRLVHRLASIRTMGAAPRFIVEGIGMALLAGLVLALSRHGLGSTIPALGMVAFGAFRLLPLANTGYASWLSWRANGSIIDDVADALSLPVKSEASATVLPFRQSIELTSVSFAYPGGPNVLDRIDLRLAHGDRVGIVGVTGVGKSTLGDLMMGLLVPDTGRLLVDAAPLADPVAWQRNIAHVGQQLFLLDGSIADNVAFGDPTPDRERIAEALHQACLPQFADRLDSPVGERGAKLSGGERQRLGLARAFYKDRPFLVLDEATNALDEETERRVLANIPAGSTVLVISHRPGALAICDHRYALVSGKLVDATA